ncbi:MAG TPA: immune inhibitor A domain-containing protein [Pilimelia sp.]|nr:immune inhibitor A domain-containing protein [Pilimelia sp.]
MRKITAGLLAATLASGAGLTLPSVAAAAPPPAPTTTGVGEPGQPSDDLISPLEAKRRELREQAISDVLSGRATPERRGGSTVVKVGEAAGSGPFGRKARRGQTGARDQYVELSREKTDRIFVILAEFGTERHPEYPDVDHDPDWPGPARFDGPLHNEIPEPDRAVDNSTVWRPDFSADHFRRLYFGTGRGDESLKQYFEAQSSGRYSVDGTVTDWVRVRYNEARYGRDLCGSNVCRNTWDLVRDAANQWVADQRAAGRSAADVAAELRTFDQWDRYDFDGDGIFSESDGYLDHFQIVHAGGDQADGDPWQGEDAIWSHRSFAFQTDEDLTGPAGNLRGGAEIAGTGLWIGDYTVQPENGGRSVFYHEYAHDLGLPDDYNILSGGDNNNEHWTLMAQSRLGARGEPFIGDRAGDLGAWNKLQLGWLDYEVIKAGQKRTLTLGPEEYNTTKPQAAVVTLPQKSVTRNYGAPFAGARQYWSGDDDDLRNTMTRQVDLTGATDAALTFKAKYSIEAGFDYLYVQASTNGGANWATLDGTVNGEPFGRDGGTQPRPALDGTTNGAWVDIDVPLDAYAGQTFLLRFLYRTDGAVAEGGFFADDIRIVADGTEVLADGAEGNGGWTLRGFSAVGAEATNLHDNYYIAGHRSYVSYDRYLKTGPYYYGYLNTRPDFVDHYAYQEGLLISYWDTSFRDNDTFAHPGQGRNLYIDAHPRPILNAAGTPWRARIQVYDAPFSLKRADSFTLHVNSVPQRIQGQPAQPLFDDTRQYWFAELPNHGVKLPAVGVQIRVLDVKGTSMKVRVY